MSLSRRLSARIASRGMWPSASLRSSTAFAVAVADLGDRGDVQGVVQSPVAAP
jgi:hypothetical protein